MELDEQVFQSLRDRLSTERCSLAHEEIRKQIQDVIQRAEQVVYSRMSQQELVRNADYIRERVIRIYEYVQEHIVEEDNLLKTSAKKS